MVSDRMQIPRWAQSAPGVFGGIAIAIGTLSLLGWAMDSQFLKSVGPAFVTIKANTAVGLLLLGISVALLGSAGKRPPVQRFAGLVAISVSFLGLLTLSQYILSIDLGIDQLLFIDVPESFDTLSPGRMAAITSVCFILAGLALHIIAEKYRWASRLPDSLLFVSGLVAIFEIVGYLFDAKALLSLGMYGGMAVHTAIAILLISMGGLLVDPSDRFIRPIVSATPARIMIRWVLPATILTPVAVVWLRLYGEQSGWYSAAVGAAVSVVTMISIFSILSLLGAHAIERAHQKIIAVENRARANDQRLRCLLNNAPISMFMREPGGRYLFANRYLEQLLQIPHGGLEGKSLGEQLRGETRINEDGKAFDAEVLSAKTSMEYEETVEVGGERRRFLSLRFPTFDDDGNLIAIGGVSTDITQLKRAEEHINNLFDLATNLVCIADLNGHFVRVNPAWETTLGYTIAELKGRPFLEFIHPDDIESTLGEYERQAAGCDVMSFENRYRAKDGSYRTLLWNATAANEEGLIFATAHDITSRKAAEEQIEKLNSALASRAAALEAANSELEAFSYSVSHDLRAPLRSIDGFSQALLEDYKGKLDATADDYLGRVSAAAQRMGELIDDLLQLSRISRTQLRNDKLDLSAMAESINHALQTRFPEQPVTTTIEANLSAVGDPGLLEVVLENLFSNAWKYTSKTNAAAIHFGCRSGSGNPIFYIRDNGVGFDMAYAGKLFGAFQRLHSAHEFSGTGIGLATVQRIIRRHGGRVWGEAEVGKGATFYFTLNTEHREKTIHEGQMHTIS